VNDTDPEKRRHDWREDLARFFLMLNHYFPLWIIVLIALPAGLLLPSLARWQGSSKSFAIVYAAQDQVYAEPILRDFEQQTGIKVRAIYDSEATKTVAIANRLLAERKHPQCDVYWGNEELRTRQLASKQVFRATNGWAAFGYRSRRIAVSATNTSVPTPVSLIELTNPVYRGKVALAYPLFGSTATHLLALRQHWGAAAWETWCRAIAANKPFLVDGNSAAARLVAKGQVTVGLTDSDDIAAENREGARLKALPIAGETLLLPNTVAVIRNAPHPEAARQLFEYLQTRAVTERLIQAGALEGALATDVWGSTLKPDWEALLRDLQAGTEFIQNAFAR
jgi:iron(III) transport system substrate-binding protein